MNSDDQEQQDLNDFHQPFEPISSQRRIIISSEDNAKLASLLGSSDLEGKLLSESYDRMVSLGLLKHDYIEEIKNSFDFDKIEFGVGTMLSSQQQVALEHQFLELELEESIMMLESGQDDDGEPLSSSQVDELESRIRDLDAQIRNWSPSFGIGSQQDKKCN